MVSAFTVCNEFFQFRRCKNLCKNITLCVKNSFHLYSPKNAVLIVFICSTEHVQVVSLEFSIKQANTFFSIILHIQKIMLVYLEYLGSMLLRLQPETSNQRAQLPIREMSFFILLQSFMSLSMQRRYTPSGVHPL